MNEPNGTDPIERLQRADPVRSNPVPSEHKARIWASIQEAIVEDNHRKSRPFLAWGAGLAAAAAVGVMAFVLLLNRGGAPGGPNPGIGSCVQTYSLATLAARDFAFDGRVIAIDGDQVTFSVGKAFKGDVGGEVTLTATGMTGTAVTSAGGPTLAIGGRYLVAGDDTFAWACGFTQPYDAGVAADWAAALP
jgi:hypothetical protein